MCAPAKQMDIGMHPFVPRKSPKNSSLIARCSLLRIVARYLRCNTHIVSPIASKLAIRRRKLLSIAATKNLLHSF
jgi:hypothetical protein